MGKIEVIEFLENQKFGYKDGNAVKYICRYRHKGQPVKDLKKAIWYLQRLVNELEGVNEEPTHNRSNDVDVPLREVLRSQRGF